MQRPSVPDNMAGMEAKGSSICECSCREMLAATSHHLVLAHLAGTQRGMEADLCSTHGTSNESVQAINKINNSLAGTFPHNQDSLNIRKSGPSRLHDNLTAVLGKKEEKSPRSCWLKTVILPSAPFLGHGLLPQDSHLASLSHMALRSHQ
ncbi:hypothetical protein C0Q70_14588 [Pomacea canaliculata]|uniref:Uncharacterized protein n=1 Tax=Pomacea canaliculata TaxID=400727 RepID=A0A2T7NSI6_POMCA|nr:hypothetical protein C0Q70_14588 [Pomacea canaliculata]